MKKQLLSLFLTLSIGAMSFTLPGSTEVMSPQPNDVVYICTGSSATKYHRTADCRGLNNCKGSIVKVTRSDAENKYHRTPCKICKP